MGPKMARRRSMWCRAKAHHQRRTAVRLLGALTEVQLLEEVVALVIDDDERREVDDFDAPDRFHAELGIFEHLDLLDAVLGEVRRSAADRAEIEAAVLLAGLAHGGG